MPYGSQERKRATFSEEIEALPKIPLEDDQIQCLKTPENYRESLLESIRNAKDRIYITSLHIENDDAGQEIIKELAEAKKRGVDVKIFVDFYRNQRSRVGADRNKYSAQVLKVAEDSGLEILGVPVAKSEGKGVLHTKGIIIDNVVYYSGASLNDPYLGKNDKFRLDRYWRFENTELANSMVGYLQETMEGKDEVQSLSPDEKIKANIKDKKNKVRKKLKSVQYKAEGVEIDDEDGVMTITPIGGLGKENLVDKAILEILNQARPADKLTIITPYFRPRKKVKKAINNALRRGVEVTIIVGDRKANDFYRSPEEIEKMNDMDLTRKEQAKLAVFDALPMLYETELRRFVRKNEVFVKRGLLNIKVWENNEDTYHAKGVFLNGGETSVITGDNLIKRGLVDAENALLMRNVTNAIQLLLQDEVSYILENTRRLESHKDLPAFSSYPKGAQSLISASPVINLVYPH